MKLDTCAGATHMECCLAFRCGLQRQWESSPSPDPHRLPGVFTEKDRANRACKGARVLPAWLCLRHCTQAVGWIAWPYLQGHAKRVPIIIASSRFAQHPIDVLYYVGLLHLCVHLCPPPLNTTRRARSTVPAQRSLGKRRPLGDLIYVWQFRSGFGLGLREPPSGTKALR